MIGQRQMTQDGFQLTGRHVLFALIGFFGVMFAVNGVFVYFATTTFSGIETKDAYRQGLAHNERLERTAAYGERGWSTEVVLAPARDSIDITVSDKNGSAVRGLDLSGRIGYPATDDADRPLSAKEVSPGRYRAQFASLENGIWELRMTAVVPGEEEQPVLELRRRLWLK